jgi:enoyl-CoA hydratase
MKQENAMKDLILVERDQGIATLTLNRPEKLNALNYALIDRLMDVLDTLETDRGIGAIILTGAGERAFSAGGDIWEFSASVGQGTEAALRDFVGRGQRLTARIESYRKPIIAAVNGLAYGGGCEITEAAPLAVAGRTARFAKPEIRLGMPPTFGGTQRLPRLAGRKRAMELLLTGESFSADRALALGLINHVVEPVQLMPAARHLAQQIMAHSPMAVGAILGAVTRGINLTIGEGLAVEAGEFARMLPTDDLRNGLAAWRERRREGHVAPLRGGV